MGSAVSSLSSIGGSVGGGIGGLIGASNASGYSSQASNEAGIANQIMQNLAQVPDISKPLVLDQYRQAGVLTPAMEQQINMGVSQASQVKANPALQAAQNQALQQMAQRSTTGLTASDRAAFNQLQSQVGAQEQGQIGQIMQNQQATTGGQGTQGASLAAKLAASQGGINNESNIASQLASNANQNALVATGQYGNMASQMNQQQFGQQTEAAKAADAFRQFDVQNQVNQQARNIQSQNQAQQYNLNNSQNIGNANVSQANQEQYNQLQRQAQQWGMQYQAATGQAAAANNYGNTLSGMAGATQQAGANLGAGLGGAAGAAGSYAANKGSSGGGGDSGGGDEEEASYTGGEAGRTYFANGGQATQPQAPNSPLSQISPIQLAGLLQQLKASQPAQPQAQMQPRSMNPYTFGAVPTATTPAIPSGSASSNPMSGASNAVDNDDQYAGTDSGSASFDPATMNAYKGGSIRNYDDGGQVSDDPISSIQIAGASLPQAVAADTGNPSPQQPQAQLQPRTYAAAPKPQQPSSGGGDGGDMGDISAAASFMNNGGESDYRSGGKVPGKAPLMGDHPKNDIVKARLSPGEIVLPRSIAMKLKGAEDADFNERLNKIVGPFIRKSQAKNMADGGEADGRDTRSDEDVNATRSYNNENYEPETIWQDESTGKRTKFNTPDVRPAKNTTQYIADGGEAESSQDSNPKQSNLMGLQFDPPVEKRDPTATIIHYDGNPQDISSRPHDNYYDDGGQVDDSNSGVLQKIGKAIKQGFEGPKATPTPTPDTDHQEQYKKIRQQNRTNFDDPTSPQALSKGGKVKKPNALALLKSFNQQFAEGGEAHDIRNLQDLKKAFNQFIDEEGKESKEKKVQKFVDGGESTSDDSDKSDDSELDKPVKAKSDDSEDDSQGTGEDPFYVKAKPNSDKELEDVGKDIFDKDDAGDQEEQELDRSKEPAPIGKVSDEDAETPEESQDKTRQAASAVTDEDQEQPQQTRESAPTVTNETIQNLYKSPLTTSDDEQPVKSSENRVTDLQKSLQHAQAQRRSILEGAQGAKYGSLIAAGLAGGHGAHQVINPASPDYFNNNELAKTPVQDVSEQIAIEKDDPQSATSKFYRQYLGDKMGVNVANDVPASGVDKLFPQLSKVIGADYQIAKAKTMADISYKNRLALQQQKQGWQQNQNDLNRSSQLEGRKMMADAMQGRVEPTVLNSAVQQVESDPVLKPLRINQQSTGLSLDMLEKKDIDGHPFPVNSQMLNDASNGFTQALALRPGAVTQKRYDQTSINTMKNNLTRFIGKYADQPDIDMREVDPKLYGVLHDYLSALNTDYTGRLQSERNRLYQEKISAFKAAGRPNLVNGLTAASTGSSPQGRPPQESKGNVSASALKDYAKQHKIDEASAAKLLKGSGYAVQGY